MVGGLLVVLAVVIVLHSPWMSVREIEIVGAEEIDVAARLDAAGIGEGAILVWLDTDEVVEAIAGHPWAAEVTAARVFPDRLLVEVRERRSVAWVEGERTWMLVAADGTVLESAPRPGGDVLRVSLPFDDVPVGLASQEPVWQEVVALGSVLEPELAGTGRIVLDASELWMELPGHRVRLGHPIDLAEKGLVLQALLTDELPAGAIVDVVAPRRPAVVPQVPAVGSEVGVEGGGEPQASPPVDGEGSGT
jgi:cell division protein FtsQ